jgi:hypothetical protein
VFNNLNLEKMKKIKYLLALPLLIAMVLVLTSARIPNHNQTIKQDCEVGIRVRVLDMQDPYFAQLDIYTNSSQEVSNVPCTILQESAGQTHSSPYNSNDYFCLDLGGFSWQGTICAKVVYTDMNGTEYTGTGTLSRTFVTTASYYTITISNPNWAVTNEGGGGGED